MNAEQRFCGPRASGSDAFQAVAGEARTRGLTSHKKRTHSNVVLARTAAALGVKEIQGACFVGEYTSGIFIYGTVAN